MLRSPEELAEAETEMRQPRVYSDRRLLGNRRRYGEFVRSLRKIGLVHFTLEPKEEVGLFFVWKKGRQAMRLILDCRRTNRRFRAPPGVDLLTSEGLSRIEVESEAGLQADEVERRLQVYLGTADVKDCFHRMRIEPPLSQWFCYPVGTAKEFGLTGQVIDGQTLTAESAVWPCAAALPMGWTWSLFFAESANTWRLGRVPRLFGSQLAYDRGPPIVLGGDDSSRNWHYVHVDNLGILSTDLNYVKRATEDAVESFNQCGLQIHEVSVECGEASALGTRLDGRGQRTMVEPRRLWRVRQAIRYALGLRRGLSGRELEVLIGHCTFCGLAARETLSVWHTAYAFIQKHYWETTELWCSTRQELLAFGGLLFLLESQWDRPWMPMVYSADASLHGWGVAESEWRRDEVAAVGRVPERARFRRVDGVPARESAMRAAGFEYEPITDRWSASAAGAEVDRATPECSEWVLDESFPEVPAELLHGSRWKLVMRDRWLYEEDILILEARALIKAVAKVAHSAPCAHCRVLMLGDNVFVILSFGRCRARDHKLLIHVRRMAAYSLARNIKFSFRWHPSEFNSSDAGSRVYDAAYDPSKDLTFNLPLGPCSQHHDECSPSSEAGFLKSARQGLGGA